MIVLPDRVEPDDLRALDGAALGLLSGGIGNVPASQTYLDIGQGTRTNGSLYDGGVPVLFVAFGEREGRVVPRQWRRAVRRAREAPASLVPGLLAETLRGADVPVRAAPDARAAAAIAADRSGRFRVARGCPPCPGLTVTGGELGDAERLARALAPRDLLIAFERPPAEDDRQLALAVAGLGGGLVTSASTRLDGLVLATDLAPTILARFGLEAPAAMAGQPVEVVPASDPAAEAQRLDDRMAAVSPRRGEAIGWTLLIWAALAALAALALRGRPARLAVALLAVAVAWLPLVLLASAALEPAEAAERLLAGIAPVALAALTIAALPGWGALAVASLASVAAHAVDVVAGSPLTSLSLLGPNPALGVRFYGIGNELEASLAAMLLAGTGAALSAWAPRLARRGVAAGFALAALAGVAAFAPGRFGADVGAAIAIPAGAAVAVVAVLGAGRRRVIVALAAVPAVLAAVALLDLALGGDAHLSRSVLEAGGLDEAGQVAERRLRLGAQSFARFSTSPVLWATFALIAAGLVWRRRVLGWFAGVPAARAGFLGAAAATLVGTLANDSGAMLLMIGTAVTSLCAGYAWATGARR